MDLTCYYEGARLLSIPYCERKIKELEDCLYDSGYKNFSEDDERVESIKENLARYRKSLKKLQTSLQKANCDKISKIIAEEIVKKLHSADITKVLVIFSLVDSYSIGVFVGNIFFTEIFTGKQLYERENLLKKQYEQSQYRFHLTRDGKDIISRIEKYLNGKLPNVNFEFRQYNDG